jgi:hypothetical protein
MHKERINNMRTTIDIPENLLKEAMQYAPAKTKTSIIIEGLKEFLRRRKIEKIRSLMGKLDLNVDLKASRAR